MALTQQLDNFVEQYVEWVQPRQGAPRIFHEMAALTICAAALGNRVWTEPGYKPRLFPSLWCCFVGPSDTHKTSAIGLAMHLLSDACPEAQLPGEFTKEAGFDIIAERPAGVIPWPEIGVPFEAMARDYNSGLVSMLTHVWDSPSTLSRHTKAGGLVSMHWPAISILAGGKERWFSEQLSSHKLIRTGFIGRWLFIQERAGNGYMPFYGRAHAERNGGPDAQIRGLLVDHLAALAQYTGIIHEGAGAQVLEDFGASLKHDEERDPAEFSSRAEEQVCKLAIAIQAAKGTRYLSELHPRAVEDAIGLWRRCYTDGRELVERAGGHSKDADELDRVFSIIKSEPRIGGSDALRRSKMTSVRFGQIVDSLVAAGRVAKDEEREGERGPKKAYYRALKG